MKGYRQKVVEFDSEKLAASGRTRYYSIIPLFHFLLLNEGLWNETWEKRNKAYKMKKKLSLISEKYVWGSRCWIWPQKNITEKTRAKFGFRRKYFRNDKDPVWPQKNIFKELRVEFDFGKIFSRKQGLSKASEKHFPRDKGLVWPQKNISEKTRP